MKNTISEIGKFNSHDDSLQPSNKLSALWLKIEKHQKRNANHIKKSDLLFKKFTCEALPYEKKQADSIAQQVEHLVGFIARKSLTEMQRSELLDWISSDIDYLDSHPFAENIDTPHLRQLMNSELALLSKKNEQHIDDDAIEQLQSMLDDMFGDGIQLEREELIDILKNPENLEQHINKFHENKREEEEDEPFDDELDQEQEQFEDDYFYHKHQNFKQKTGKYETTVLEKLFKGSQLNKMYKRLAAKLHPDKENDPDKKQIKHDLMQQLVSARKNKDAFTMLTLYHEHIDDDSFNFDTETITALESLLEQKISELNLEHKQLKSNQTPAGVVWSHFKGRSNKITTQNIQNHVTQLSEEVDKINNFILKTKTIKTLKAELNARIEQNKSELFLNFGGNLEDLFNVPF